MSEADRVEQAYRRHWARLLALLTSELRDLDLAEESLQDAFAAAVSAWPPVPDNPPAWLLTTARRRAFDRLRRTAVAARKAPLLIVEEPDRHEVPDDLLRLIFTCCHPALAPEARVPSGPELAERRDGVLAVIYLIFTEGYAAAEGDALIRDAPADEAIALARMLAGLMPADHEVRALLALMLLHHARRDARLDPCGRLVLLAEQDRSRWHRAEIDEALAVLEPGPPGFYQLQAAIAAEHALAATPGDTDWRAIAALYELLERLTSSAVVRLNRAVAVAEAEGPQAGLDLLAGLEAELPRHHLLPAARAELLRRLGRLEEAVAAYDRALELVATVPEREFLLGRRAEAEQEHLI